MSEPLAVAFLRGMNVGGHRITNAALAHQFRAAGLTDVATFQAAGNVVFRAPNVASAEIETRIERALDASLGYAVPTMVRSMTEVAGIVDALAETPPADGITVHIAFLRSRPTPAARRAMAELATPVDQLRLDGRTVYWRRHGKLMEAGFSMDDLRRVLDQELTMRTAGTLERLVGKFGPDQG